jgi:hypothetical protein
MSEELVRSVSVANLVSMRGAVLERLDEAVRLIREAAEIAAAGHLGMPRVSISTRLCSGERLIANARLRTDWTGAALEANAADLAEVHRLARVGVDAGAWQHLMHESGLRSLMDAKAREDWDRSIDREDVPELTDANIRSTFGMLHGARSEIFERGVIGCFRSLSWSHRTNLPQKFGRRIVLRFMRTPVTGRFGEPRSSLGSPDHRSCDTLDDLARVFSVLDGRPEPDHRSGWYGRMSRCGSLTDPEPEDEYMRVRSFRNGNAHVTFRRPDLVDGLNRIVARHFPGALPEPK